MSSTPATRVRTRPPAPKAPTRRTAQKTETRRSLTRAFESFTTAAGSLERSYTQLQAEVLRLRFDLERTNRDLTTSLEENARMRMYLSRVLESLPCGVLVANREGDVRFVNPEGRRLLKIGAAETVDESADPVLPAELLRAASGPARPDEAEELCELQSETGQRTIGLSCAVLADDDSSSGESIFLLRDVTEERNRAAEREAARRRESLAEMAMLLAHEIRNPLGSLELFAGLLADAAVQQPDLRRWTDHVQAGLRSLSATVNNVLQFHSQPEPQLAPVNLGRLIRDSVEFLRPLARQGGVRIDLQNSLGELEVPADAHRLQQVFFNLALNAFRAMSTGGVLTVRLQWDNFERLDEVRVDFQDTGRGIAAEKLEKIFEPGFTSHAGNPGLGLAVCRSVVEQHHGTIHVNSEQGKGTTFSLILPRVGGLE